MKYYFLSIYFLNCYQTVVIKLIKMAFEIHGFLRGVNLGHEKQIVRLFHYILLVTCKRNPQIKKTQNTNNPYSFKTFLGRFFKTCQLSKFKAKSYLAHNCKIQMFFDDQLIILTAYTVSLSYIVTQFWT